MTVQVKFKQYVQWMVTDGGITVQKGVIDHSLPSAVRRLCSVGARLIYCYQLPGRVRVWPTHTHCAVNLGGARLLKYGRE